MFFNNDSFHVHNLSQTNPIIFNDRWSLAHDLKADLKPGDTFTIGQVRMRVALPVISSNGHNGSGFQPDLRCPSCGRTMEDERATCPLCRTSINEFETVLIANDG